MNLQRANNLVKHIEDLCKNDDIWYDVQYVNHPDLRMIKIEMSIKIAPKNTRKMEVRSK